MSRTSYNPFYTNSWAVVVGINEYESAGTLSYAIHDAEAVYELLIDQLDFEKGNIHLFLNEDATRLNIFKALTKIQEESIKNDRVVFFFAGHGYTRVGVRGPVGYLIPTDGDTSNLGSLITFNDLIRTSELISAKHMGFIMDVCYGGVMLKRTVPPGTQRFLRDMMQRYSRQVITAGKADEPVDDGGGPGGLNSIFTGHLIEGLTGKAANADGVLTANDLMHYVYTNVSNDPLSDQTPHYGYLYGDGDLILQTPNNEHLDSKSGTDFMIEVPPQSFETTIDTTQSDTDLPFFKRNGYMQPEHPSFGRNNWSDKLGEIRRDSQSSIEIHKGYSWMSLIAEPISKGKVEIDIAKEISSIPYNKPADTPPYTLFQVPSNKQTSIDTAIMYENYRKDKKIWKSYLRIDKGGNIEYAESSNVFMELNSYRLFRYVTLIGLCWQFQFLVKEILEHNNYDSGVRVYVNLVGTRDTILAEFSNEKGVGGNVWAEPFRDGLLGEHIHLLELRCPNTNLQLVYEFLLNDHGENSSKKIIDNLAEQLSLAYNHQSMPRCFNYETYEFPWRQFFTSRNSRSSF